LLSGNGNADEKETKIDYSASEVFFSFKISVKRLYTECTTIGSLRFLIYEINTPARSPLPAIPASD
jgi:hypothetical protein